MFRGPSSKVILHFLYRGRSVLNQKSELQRAMEKHKDERIKKELGQMRLESRSPFEKVIGERAKRLEEVGIFSFMNYFYYL